MAFDSDQKFRFRSISGEQIDRISLNFMYAFILTRPRLKMLPVIVSLLVIELWPLIYERR